MVANHQTGKPDNCKDASLEDPDIKASESHLFFYETLINDGIDLLPGVEYCLRQFNSFILSITRSAWIKHIK